MKLVTKSNVVAFVKTCTRCDGTGRIVCAHLPSCATHHILNAACNCPHDFLRCEFCDGRGVVEPRYERRLARALGLCQ